MAVHMSKAEYENRNKAIFHRWRAGETTEALAKEYEVGEQRILQIIRDLGGICWRYLSPQQAFSRDLAAYFLWQTGLTYREVGSCLPKVTEKDGTIGVERARQLINRARRRMRHPRFLKRLLELIRQDIFGDSALDEWPSIDRHRARPEAEAGAEDRPAVDL